ncbi:MAG: formylglycine-generating enzyme family protein [Thermodesulfobacteriota bacterium]
MLVLILPILFSGCAKEKSLPENMVLIPAGEFIIGSNRVDTDAKAMQYGSRKPWFANESPERKVDLKAFYIDRTEVTMAAYSKFLSATSRKPPADWPGGRMPEGRGEYPVTNVSWFDASEYCKWKGGRLPTEQEWEKAARGTDGRVFPWGAEFDIKKVNTLGEYGGVTPVGKFPDGASPYGVLDMAGNVQEWTADWYTQYPGNTYDDKDYGEKFKVVRGGGWGGMGHYTMQVYVSAPFRSIAPPRGGYNDVGFRCVSDG